MEGLDEISEEGRSQRGFKGFSLALPKKHLNFTVPPAVALLN